MARAGHPHRRWRLSGHKKAHIDAVRNDINVTPLVDVMLVLLIIFMLMTLIMGRGYDVQLPKAHNFSEEKDKMQPVVSIDMNGNLYVEKQRLGPITEGTLKEMGNLVQAQWAAPKTPEAAGRIYVKADNNLPYGKIYPLLRYIHEDLQLESVDLAIAKEGEGGQ